ncbi:hypothetical protein ACOSP7_027723 [Xanthoceras sorbifolium]
MYYLSLAAYYIFFNSSKVFYFLSLLVLASFYMFTVILKDVSMGNIFQELAGFVCNEKARTWVCLQLQDNPDFHFHSNSSFYELPLVSRLIK